MPPHDLHLIRADVDGTPPLLAGRKAECAAVDAVLEQARAGQGRALVVRGQTGVGKTALLDHAVARADGFRTIRIHASESEAGLAYAGLQLLSSALDDGAALLQPAHRQALDTALGWRAGEPERLLLGLAVVSLLANASSTQPILCIVDDAQWLDRFSAQAMAFASRRLAAQPVAVLIAERDSPGQRDFDGLSSLRLAGLSHADARSLMGSVIRGPADEGVIGRIIVEARGIPRVLVDAALAIASPECAGGYGLDMTPRLSSGDSEEALEHLDDLGPDSRRLLLLAAADPTGDPALLWRAAAAQGLPAGAAMSLDCRGLMRIGSRVTFCDPAARSAIYASAGAEDKRWVHDALAAATDPTSSPDRRAWHKAHAAQAPDDDLALELDRCVARARDRAGPAAAAAFLERAASLTRDSALRCERALAAAEAMFAAGAPDAAVRLLATAELAAPGASRRGRMDRLRARMAFASGRGDESLGVLLEAARTGCELEPSLAQEACLEALAAVVFTGRLGRDGVPEAVAKVASASQGAGLPPATGRLLDGLGARASRGYAAAHEPLSSALEGWEGRGIGDSGPALWLIGRVAADLWDDEAWHKLTDAGWRRAEATGSRVVLPYALTCRAIVEIHRGQLGAASALVAEANALSAGMNSPPLACASLMLAGWRGHERPALALFDSARRNALDRGEGVTLATASFAEAVLFNGLGCYDAALAAARDAAEVDELGLFGLSLVELIEAAARSGCPETAAAGLERLTDSVRASRTDWAYGMEARSRALVTDGNGAEGLYRESIERLARSRITVHHARAQLLYGEWLRRQGRRVDARAQLRAAQLAFAAMGAEAFASRAGREHLATGEKARRRGETPDQLTSQETRIAFLARDGLTNPEIGGRLFVSPRTVEYHLHKVFEKLGIRSRGELHLVLDGAVSSPDGWSTASVPPRKPQLSRRIDVA
jgi:DNA-binding CsgD family transcriptional regulator